MENFKILNQLEKINDSIIRLTDYIIDSIDKTNSHLILLIKAVVILTSFITELKDKN